MAVGDVHGCVIVSGMPGAGKSTVTGLAARLLPKAAQVKGDDMNQMIQSGYVAWMEQPVDEALRQDQLCNRNICAVANNFVDFGFTVLMDTVLADRAELDFFLALLSPDRSGSSSSRLRSMSARAETRSVIRKNGSTSMATNASRTT